MVREKRKGLCEGRAEEGLAFCREAVSRTVPSYSESEVIAPLRTIGFDASSSLKAAFWHSTIEESHQVGDLDFLSIAMNTGGGRVWRNSEATPTDVGELTLQPFEGARWRFENPVSFLHLYVPFRLLSDVCESLFDRELRHADLSMPAGIRNDRLCDTAHLVRSGLTSIEPTNLILDSWALMLAEKLVRGFSSHANRKVRSSFGKISARGIAHVIDYVETNIDLNLRLDKLASVAAMSTCHFARRFKETVGVSPHTYVLTRRVRHAQAQLKATRRSIADIAATSGFSNQAHLTSTFQRLLGMTPVGFRRSVQSV